MVLVFLTLLLFELVGLLLATVGSIIVCFGFDNLSVTCRTLLLLSLDAEVEEGVFDRVLLTVKKG